MTIGKKYLDKNHCFCHRSPYFSDSLTSMIRGHQGDVTLGRKRAAKNSQHSVGMLPKTPVRSHPYGMRGLEVAVFSTERSSLRDVKQIILKSFNPTNPSSDKKHSAE